jgi:putative PEP-CTERM system TPR-repeat lipoprotein
MAHPRNPAVLRALAIAQLRTGENKQATTTIDTLSEVIPESPQGYYLLALMQLNQKKTNAARTNLQHALILKKDFPEAHVALGRINIASKDFNAALNTADRLQQAYPDSAYGYELKADVHAVRHEYKKAVAAYTLAHDKSSTPQLAHKLFRARLLAGEGKSAREEIRRWLVKHPEDIPVRRLLASSELSLASAALASGQPQRAIKEYLRILEYDPDNVTALNNVAWLYQQKGNPDSVKYARRAYEQAPDRPQVIATLGWVLVQNGDVEHGLLLLQDAASRAPNKSGIRYRMAVALDLAGRSDEALRELSRLLKQRTPFPDRERARALRNRLRLGD